jgi:hypothetical protein
MTSTTRSIPFRASGLVLGFLATPACQSHGSPSAAAGTVASTSVRFQCGPTDDVELAMVVAAPGSADESAGMLSVTLGSGQWRRLERGERRLEVAPGESARWCMTGDDCKQPERLVFAFDRVSLAPGGEVAGEVEVQLDRRSVSLPVIGRVVGNSQRCG